MFHVSITKGDYVFAEWDDENWEQFRKKVDELRQKGYRKINSEHGYLNYYEYYRKKGSKKVITLTMMCM